MKKTKRLFDEIHERLNPPLPTIEQLTDVEFVRKMPGQHLAYTISLLAKEIVNLRTAVMLNTLFK